MVNEDELIDLAQKADQILKEVLDKAGIEYDTAKVNIYNCRTVGVQGDARADEYATEIRLYPERRFVWDVNILSNLSTRITNEVVGINRVVYIIASKEN